MPNYSFARTCVLYVYIFYTGHTVRCVCKICKLFVAGVDGEKEAFSVGERCVVERSVGSFPAAEWPRAVRASPVGDHI